MSLSREEMETIVNYNAAESTASVYTCDKALIRRLNKMSEVSSDVAVLKSNEISAEYIIPKKWIKIKMPRQYSQEQRLKMAERAKVNLRGKVVKTNEEK